MFKLAKYLKPFIAMVIAAVLLLFVQAMCDLALPDYMSDIVNKGIQQSGIASAVPEAVRQSEMDKLMLFMDKDDKNQVQGQYTLIDKSSADYDEYLKKYPNIKNESVYVLNKINKKGIEKLNPIMGKAFLAVSGVQKIKASAKGGIISFNGMKIPANADLFAMIKKMPEDQVLKMSQSMNEKFTALGDNMIIQSAAGPIKAEYTALGMNTDKIQNKYIINTGIIMMLISFLGAFCAIGVGFFSAKTAAGTARNLRRDIFEKVESFSNAEFDKFSTASLITRTTNDITQIQMLIVIMIRVLCYAPILGIGGVIRALQKNVSMSWIIALAVIVLLCLILIVFSIAMPKFKIVQKLVDKLNLVTRENLSGMMVIRAFNTQKFEEKRFDKANHDLTDTNLFINRIMVLMMPVMMLIMNGTSLLIVWVGSHEIQNSSMQVGDMMAFIQYAMQIIMSFLMLSVMFIMIPRASVSARRAAEVLDTDITILDPKNPQHFNEDMNGIVEFDNVSFRYSGAQENMLKNISFVALPGQTTAIIGATGSGKTTLVNLIPRFYDVTDGRILIHNIDIRNITQHELRNKIGYVPQKSCLFSGTIKSNLKYADENADCKHIEKAADVAQAMEFINAQPEGMESEISEGGTNVSVCQKQRLSIARAIVKKPEIYIFDDSFSALDFKTDASLRRALKDETGSSTVIIVAQRISTIMNAEQIIVLDDGKIVGKGTHKELMENCETYREIAFSQLSKEELA